MYGSLGGRQTFLRGNVWGEMVRRVDLGAKMKSFRGKFGEMDGKF
jgi:hypothetical protein